MARTRIPSSFFVFVIVEHAGHILLIRERKHGQLWYAPAGGLEPGETIREAAIRETMEEAGVLIEPTTLLNIEQQWYPDGSMNKGGGLTSWWRFILRARPVHVDLDAVGSAQLPAAKSWPDEHSLEARWVRPEALATFPLRHPEVIDLVALALASSNGPAPCCAEPRGHEPNEPKDWSASRSPRDVAVSNVLGAPPIADW